MRSFSAFYLGFSMTARNALLSIIDAHAGTAEDLLADLHRAGFCIVSRSAADDVD